jgi:holo-[acyl-carrier protein] synthase
MIIGIGIDLAEIARFRLDEQGLAWFAKRIFTDEEIAYATKKRLPAQHLAGCFAVKEALRKALGHGIPWRTAGVLHNAKGAPMLSCNKDIQNIFDERGILKTHITITHNRTTAAAVVILEG